MKKKSLRASERRASSRRQDLRADNETAPRVCRDCARIEYRLNTLIAWMAQSANSPISVSDAERLINEVGNE